MCEWEKSLVQVESGLYVCLDSAYLLVYTLAYMWEQEADQWVRTPSDSALHGKDTCFMSMGSHKLHSPAVLLQQRSTGLSVPSSLSIFSHSLNQFFPSCIFTFPPLSCLLLPFPPCCRLNVIKIYHLYIFYVTVCSYVYVAKNTLTRYA